MDGPSTPVIKFPPVSTTDPKVPEASTLHTELPLRMTSTDPSSSSAGQYFSTSSHYSTERHLSNQMETHQPGQHYYFDNTTQVKHDGQCNSASTTFDQARHMSPYGDSGAHGHMCHQTFTDFREDIARNSHVIADETTSADWCWGFEKQSLHMMQYPESSHWGSSYTANHYLKYSHGVAQHDSTNTGSSFIQVGQTGTRASQSNSRTVHQAPRYDQYDTLEPITSE